MKITKSAARTVLLAIVSGAVIAGATVCQASPADRVQSACAALGGVIADQICHAHNATPDYTVDVRFPVDYADQQALIDAVTQERDRFVDQIAQSMPRSFPYQLNIIGDQYRSGTSASGTQSLAFHIGSDLGIHPVTRYMTLNYDLSKHVPITFDTLFRPGTQPLEVLKPIVQRELDKHEAARSLDDLGVNAYQNFAVTDDTVIFFFDQDGLIPHEDGPLEVSVPRAELAAVLA